MRSLATFLACLLAASGATAVASQNITTGSLLEEMSNLDDLARWPSLRYRTVQFSSYDRRSSSPEAPGWFSNADGFGQEPIPGFLKVLRAATVDQSGLYLIAEVNGPGAIVRGWSAGMNGVLRVQIDATDPTIENSGLVWEGKAYDFLARRSAEFAKRAGVQAPAGDAFTQQDADYLPIPFARNLRVTWEGSLNELHFYHLQVRLYPEGVAVRSFSPNSDLKEFEREFHAAARRLTAPSPGDETGELGRFKAEIQPGTAWIWNSEVKGPAAIREFKIRVPSDEKPDCVLRGCLLRISFDGSQRPQVEAPLGDFFGSGPGVNPFSSLPFSVAPDGTMTCRFVMPYEKSARIEIVNHTPTAVSIAGSVRTGFWNWDEFSMHFRAKWRADHDLLAGAGVIDLPYALVIGKGVFVGCAAMVMNPAGVPTAGGNWWGEGDEKFIVDGEQTPSTFGTGSEDYFNYSWSRPDLFDHPYCGQPLDSGPDTAGYVSNHRFQVIDAIPFERSLAALMELWTHRRTPGLSYSRIAYLYARPGAIDDHRGLAPSDLKIPVLPKRELVAAGAATGARFFLPTELKPVASAGAVELVPAPLATQLQVLQWNAPKGARLTLSLENAKDGPVEIHPVLVHSPNGAVVRASIAGHRLKVADSGSVPLRAEHSERVLNVNFNPVSLKTGTHELVLECEEPGTVGLDYVWVKPGS